MRRTAYTRFIVVKPEFLSGCEVALGEDCGKQDIEDEDDGESFTDEEHDDNDDDDTSNSPEQSIDMNSLEHYQSETSHQPRLLSRQA